MSRSEAWMALALMASAMAAAPAAAQDQAAQDQSDKNVGAMITQQRETYSPPPAPRPDACADATGSDIVVCGAENGDRYRLQGSTDTGAPQTKQGLQVSPGGVSLRGCFLQKCPKQLYLIDLKSIPVAPPGSDADKISKGEMRAP